MIIINENIEQITGTGAELTFQLSKLFSLLEEAQFVEESKKCARKDNEMFLEWLQALENLVEINKQMAYKIKEIEEKVEQKGAKQR